MPQPRTVSLTDRLALIRNRLLSSQRFQAFAAGVPGLRGFARSSAYDLFNLCAGFSYSQILLACVELDLLHHLQDAPRTSADIASLTGLHLPGADRLVRAAVALKLAERRSGERFGVGPRGAMLLANPSVLEMVRHHKHFYADLVDPVAMLKDRPKSSNLARFWGYPSDDGPASVSEHVAAPYSALMEATQAFIAQEVLTAYNVSDHEHIMDIGGGTGAFLSAAAARAPNLAMTLVDLPEVAALAAERFKREGLENRALAHGADAFREPLPNNADLISLIRILHDHDDAPVRQLLRNIRKALKPGGRLLIAEPMAETRGAEQVGDAYFGFYLWAMGTGRPRSASELEDMLRDTGFETVKQLKTRQPLLVSGIIAQ